MIIDISGTELIPGNSGFDCPGNGEHIDVNGRIIECCCDECDYMLCCLDTHNFDQCINCKDEFCPRLNK